MQNMYPLFERNRILKKELLWSLRDYSFSHAQLDYQEYGEGIIRGCALSIHEKELTVEPGIIKCGRFICLMKEDERIPFAPADQMQFLKFRVETNRSSPDCILYNIELYLDMDEALRDNEFELCRFHLRHGAQLRGDYKDFADMNTEYDTVNLIHSSWGGLGGKLLAPKITRMFSEAILTSENVRPEDRSFAYLCLSQPGAIPAAILNDYVYSRLGEEKCLDGNLALYENMCEILGEANRGGGGRTRKRKEKHRILVD